MIKKTCLATLMFIVCLSVTGQTTQEEYNYITKGYKIQIESGLDMKKGYSLYELHPSVLKWSNGETRNCYFKALFRDGESKPCAIMMLYKRTDTTNQEHYFCIPTLNASDYIWQQTFQELVNISDTEDSKALLQTMVWGLMKLNADNMKYVTR